MEVKICTNEVLLKLLFRLMQTQNRNSVTASEVERFQKYISEEAKKQNVEVSFFYDMTERLDLIRKFIDTVVINGKVVYRLNLSITFYDVRKLATLLDFYQKQHINLTCVNDEEFLASLNDFTSESEKESIDFKHVDENRQLNIIYQLFAIEKQKRELEKKLNMMQLNGASGIDEVEAEAILEQYPEITEFDFIGKMMR